MSPQEEGLEIIHVLDQYFPKRFEAKDSIRWLHTFSNQKRQNEWAGFFFQEYSVPLLTKFLGGWKGPLSTDPLFKEAGPFVRMLKVDAVKRRITRVAENAGIRKPLVKGKRKHDVPIMNGFRRFFNKLNKETISKDSPLAALIKKEYMMDHVGLVKLDRNYFKTHISELVEEYLNAVPHLTISDEEREKALNKKLRIENKDLYQKNIRIAELEKNQEMMTRWMMRFKELHPEIFTDEIPVV